MKRFNPEAAKAGKPICTRNGKSARIVCWDLRTDNGMRIVAAILDNNNIEHLYTYNEKGVRCYGSSSDDLMMASTTHIGYIPILKNSDGTYCNFGIYNTKEEAEKTAKMKDGFITVVKVQWEED